MYGYITFFRIFLYLTLRLVHYRSKHSPMLRLMTPVAPLLVNVSYLPISFILTPDF